MAKLLVVGGGRMGEALLGGLVRAGWDPSELAVVETLESRRRELSEKLQGVRVVSDVVSSDGAVLAVKPHDTPAAARSVAASGVARVLSVAAGVTIASLQEILDSDVPIVRAMPNTPALVGAGAAAIAGGPTATEADLAWAESVLGAVGTVVRVSEAALDAVTGLSGSGPAYVFLVAEALIEAGVLVGLPRDVSERLAIQTLVGSARLLAEGSGSPADHRAAVTSPGGTTAAGLRELERAGLRAAFLDAVTAATTRSRELGA